MLKCMCVVRMYLAIVKLTLRYGEIHEMMFKCSSGHKGISFTKTATILSFCRRENAGTHYIMLSISPVHFHISKYRKSAYNEYKQVFRATRLGVPDHHHRHKICFLTGFSFVRIIRFYCCSV